MPARSGEMTRTYVLVLVVEAVTLAALYWLQQVFA
jgi:hypothetical protein